MPAAGLLAGWTHWKAGPQAVKPAHLLCALAILHPARHKGVTFDLLTGPATTTNFLPLCPLAVPESVLLQGTVAPAPWFDYSKHFAEDKRCLTPLPGGIS